MSETTHVTAEEGQARVGWVPREDSARPGMALRFTAAAVSPRTALSRLIAQSRPPRSHTNTSVQTAPTSAPAIAPIIASSAPQPAPFLPRTVDHWAHSLGKPCLLFAAQNHVTLIASLLTCETSKRDTLMEPSVSSTEPFSDKEKVRCFWVGLPYVSLGISVCVCV